MSFQYWNVVQIVSKNIYLMFTSYNNNCSQSSNSKPQYLFLQLYETLNKATTKNAHQP